MNRTLLTGLLMTGMLLCILITGPYLPFVDETLEKHLLLRDEDNALLVPPHPPSADFLLGTDRKGVDLLSKLIVGTRETFYIIGVIVILRLVLALFISIGAFYLKSVRLVMNVWNSAFSFMPTIFIILILLAVPGVMFSDYRSFWVLAIVSLVEVGRLAIIFYHTLHDQQKKGYMEAAIANGGTRWGLFKNYYWQSLKREILVSSAMESGRVMFMLVQLGVIGIYVNQQFMSQLDHSYRAVDVSNSWPVLLSNLRQDVYSAQWIPLFALFSMTFAIISFYVLADGFKKRQAIKTRSNSW